MNTISNHFSLKKKKEFLMGWPELTNQRTFKEVSGLLWGIDTKIAIGPFRDLPILPVKNKFSSRFQSDPGFPFLSENPRHF